MNSIVDEWKGRSSYFKGKIELKSVKVKREEYLGLGQTSQE